MTTRDYSQLGQLIVIRAQIGAWRAGTNADPQRALLNSYPMGVFTSLFNVTGHSTDRRV
jgi:hypothetical protein